MFCFLFHSLEAASSLRFLVDVSETGLLLPLLEQAGCRKKQRRIDTSHTESSGEDIIDEDVGKAGYGRGAASHQGGGGGRRAGCISDKCGRSAVEVAAAGKL